MARKISKRAKAFDDKNRKKGIYRKEYLDKNDLDKNNNPKLKFNYYYSLTNKEVSDEDIVRINKLGLAPAYKNVWVSTDPKSKIQATGFDAKGRKQYRYHPDHIIRANENKFLRLYKFIKAMPLLDKQIELDKKKDIYSKDRVISLMLLIIKELNMRVGKEVYARRNKSYGISSLKKTHLSFSSENTLKFNYKGKSNKHVSYTLKNPDIVNDVKELMKLEGEKIFQYHNDKENSLKNILKITDADINQYIQQIIGKQFSVKDFRTYAANYYFMKALLNITQKRKPKNKKIIKQNLGEAQENTAFYLRHTKSISKKSYTMALIREMYQNKPEWFIKNAKKDPLIILIKVLKTYKNIIKDKRKINKLGQTRILRRPNLII